MRTRNTVALAIAASFVLSGVALGAEQKTAIETIRDFYKSYLSYNYHETPNLKPPSMVMSKSFSKAVKKNGEICAAYVSGICGWAAGADEYLDTQETDPKLTYLNSGIKLVEIKPNVVQVKLNVYPSMKDAKGYYDKTITYKMVKENGRWVMDDVIYSDGVSSRRKMDIENSYAIAHPDPDSPSGKRHE